MIAGEFDVAVVGAGNAGILRRADPAARAAAVKWSRLRPRLATIA
jgi:hypothetical protein